MNSLTCQPQQSLSMFDNKKLDLLKNTICKGASDEEFELFLHACQRTCLDPFMRQIYAVKRWDSSLRREAMTIQTGIDGYRLIAERTGKYSPGREPTYQYNDKGHIISSTAYVKKQTSDGTWHEVAATAFFDEYCQKTKEGKPTRFWMQLGHAMIAKCAEALALRKAFPGDLSGIYTKEEMMQADVLEVNADYVRESQKKVVDIPTEIIQEPIQEEIVKYISKFQLKMFNEKYDQISNPSSDYYDKNTCAVIDQAISNLDIEEFPSLEKMKENDWMKFMKSFDRYFDKKKKADLAEAGMKEYAVN